ncbi:arginyl-tRNA-protein transferase [Catenovulum agarivorans DS-2]|uniref:Aspartate/glutamate leucyltransferase n=1 Tax=Catenovulum agarivorans DS-2 TaxID=1328313 RepID=W7QM12_9ALTE|nr:arginyltransferase [Catenovulum agarivorans]EWH09997.1 arginyl-tRNA-protein transferase [Catenovulum agarivorans DS-2]
MSHNIPIQFGISEEFVCDYLPDNKERLLVALDNIVYTPENYEKLMALGFRRSGYQVYRPHCQQCQACQSIRIDSQTFKPSKSQKRLLNKNRDIQARIVYKVADSDIYYPLYQKYIEHKHADGSMYPPSLEQFNSFVKAAWLDIGFLELSVNGNLVAVSVVDALPNSFSAVYTFYDPLLANRSLGTFAILQLIELARMSQRQFVYLGYQVDGCNKMNYKSRFYPHQRLEAGHWINIQKTKKS